MPVSFGRMPKPSEPPRFVVTGATGFVGRALARALGECAALRLGIDEWRAGIERAEFRGAAVFHLAARVHEAGASEGAFERDNVEKTAVLAQAAARGGARRFVFLSTVKVNGDETLEEPYRPGDREAPSGAYARSKWRAEEALRDVGARLGLPVVIVRAPLVVGPGAGGNLRALLALCAKPWPLPLASVRNRRTFVQVDDLAEVLSRCAGSPGVEGRVLFAGDPRSLSTPALITAIRGAWGRPARLFAFPPVLLEAGASLGARGERMRRLTRSLEIDVSATMRELAWQPAHPMPTAIAEMARAFRAQVPA
jgi:nucleoside-diphosphate-sugar epimerase